MQEETAIATEGGEMKVSDLINKYNLPHKGYLLAERINTESQIQGRGLTDEEKDQMAKKLKAEYDQIDPEDQPGDFMGGREEVKTILETETQHFVCDYCFYDAYPTARDIYNLVRCTCGRQIMWADSDGNEVELERVEGGYKVKE